MIFIIYFYVTLIKYNKLIIMDHIPDHINTPELLQTYYDVSVDREHDEYNDLGVNVSSYKRRQALVPWTKVVYKKNVNNTNDEIDDKIND